MCYLVISRDDDLRVAESRDLLARGEAAVRLLDERGQVVDARSTQLFENLDLKEVTREHFERHRKPYVQSSCGFWISCAAICSTAVAFPIHVHTCKQPVAEVTCVFAGSLRYSMHVKPIVVLVETSKVTGE